MLDIKQLRDDVIRPVLTALNSHSVGAEALLLGTAAQESHVTYLRQLGGGPALGIYQMEPATHDDIWDNYLAYRGTLAEGISAYLAPNQPRHDQLI